MRVSCALMIALVLLISASAQETHLRCIFYFVTHPPPFSLFPPTYSVALFHVLCMKWRAEKNNNEAENCALKIAFHNKVNTEKNVLLYLCCHMSKSINHHLHSFPPMLPILKHVDYGIGKLLLSFETFIKAHTMLLFLK